MDVKKCTVCNIKIDEDIYKKLEIYVGSVTILIEKKHNINNKEKIQVVNSVNKT